ncbi:hypothetical protein EXN65_16930 [Clostridium botulinum]|uniref:Uncharacterized protein n=1 Tax=Clostridium botulinum TaxID=1491 RepID=A0A846I5I3_CLOBO|nr:hypothetical protein RSJ19_09955 [Clostridium botulinum]MBN3397258.1 hypothetical protein [Clostridium botulinum]MBN3412921.1 hypothetical protein [Clostridium botulinum]NEZ88043.1 hypothetical protein [Clostridium botulinum]NEZ93329.1 hypothetical protein [Clostridium botulinum]
MNFISNKNELLLKLPVELYKIQNFYKFTLIFHYNNTFYDKFL